MHAEPDSGAVHDVWLISLAHSPSSICHSEYGKWERGVGLASQTNG